MANQRQSQEQVQSSSQAWADGAAAGMQQGVTLLPYALLRNYRRAGLSDRECMLLIHLLSFQQNEQNAFPSLEELQAVTGTPMEAIAEQLQKLMKAQWITIDEFRDPNAGIQYERYNLQGVYEKLAALLSSQQSSPPEMMPKPGQRFSEESRAAEAWPPAEQPVKEERNLFRIFEREFGRPLSPMELETISGWLDQDRYPDELILLALKEAVFAGKVHFRYIDRILLEWSRNRVRNAEEARAYAQKFRNIGR
ncbi:DnaD domain-containing protein [Paenibacillus sp. F411]|uniref:DnaD domain-containing protein n=1 Tax=Paenibacillus sp. F411 TaxID=2820239 RepID=UPI001AAE1BA0|nr:DnaD domain-containing protein [Paenibacillus sp. F411]MBO2943135.1 DnaD domain-containing protein [Paenibacillus sp. F411]